MTTTTTTTCDHKQPKLSVSDAMRARNGGKDGSLLPASASPDDGSDTENENDEETNQFYLSKMSDDTDRKTETVFGKGVEVWRSHGETVYADLTDKVKRKMREEELWDEEAKMKVETGLKRKMSDMKKEYSTKDIKTMDTTEKKEGDVTDPALPTEVKCPIIHSAKPRDLPLVPTAVISSTTYITLALSPSEATHPRLPHPHSKRHPIPPRQRRYRPSRRI
jgi:hypothetical protein